MYIVFETHGGAEHATICTDENGKTKVFATWEEAELEACKCQDGKVIDLSGNLIKIVVAIKKGTVETILSNLPGKNFDTGVIDLDAQDERQEQISKNALHYATEVLKLNRIL